MQKRKSYEPLDAAIIGKATSFPVTVLEETDSTNTEARRRILVGATEPCFLFAETQSAGRGRMGRSFYSPHGTGIYLTLSFPAPHTEADPLPITTAAAVATHRAIFRATGISTGIKWVNDLIYKDRKVAGILAESMTVEDTRYVILGVGINLSTEEFPEELSDVAGSLAKSSKGLRNRLAAALCAEWERLTAPLADKAWLSEYRAHSTVLGRRVVYTENGVRHEAEALAIDERGGLFVRHADGSERTLSSGEISLRTEQ